MQFKQYEEVLEWIHGTLRLGIKPGLERMEFLLAQLGNPERANKWVHVAGTNGKGSTVTFIREVLEKSGYKVGTFTSPYIETFNERICINGRPIANQDLITAANRVYPIAQIMKNGEFGPPSEFEIITAIMFVYFKELQKIDIGIIEVGLGGRLDSTNVLQPLVSVITTIGMDHMEFLGNDLAAIASEKAGIIKATTPVVSGVLQPEAQQVIRETASRKESALYEIERDFRWEQQETDGTFREQAKQLTNLKLGLAGFHQYHNAALAVKTVQLLKQTYAFDFICEKAIREGLAAAFWPGRMEQITKEPVCILDGAHNPEGVRAFAENATAYQGKKTVLCSILGDKDYQEMLETLAAIPETELFLTTFDFPRAMDEAQLHKVSEKQNITAVTDWKNWLVNYMKSDEKKEAYTLFITGSLYFISEVRKFLRQF